MTLEFCYAAVLRRDIPLVQHCPKPGNFDLFFQKYTEKNTLPIGRTIVLADGFLWGMQLQEDGLTFVCVIKHSNDQSILDKALDDIKSRFIRANGSSWIKASPFAYQTSFEPQLALVKQSILSIAGVPISPPKHDQFDGNEDMEDSLLVEDNEYDGDRLNRERNLKITIEPVKFTQNNKLKEVLFWALSLIFGAALVYMLLIIICGGFDLKPRCL